MSALCPLRSHASENSIFSLGKRTISILGTINILDVFQDEWREAIPLKKMHKKDLWHVQRALNNEILSRLRQAKKGSLRLEDINHSDVLKVLNALSLTMICDADVMELEPVFGSDGFLCGTRDTDVRTTEAFSITPALTYETNTYATQVRGDAYSTGGY
ncbi:hypothetical protein APSETT444_008402 [Aspergillus pseudonomiae]